MAITQGPQNTSNDANHPLSLRMAIIAGVSHNMVVGSIFGSFGVLIASVQARMNVSPEEAALGIPLVVVTGSLLAPVIGVLVSKYSLRLLLIAGAVLATLAFLLLAFSTSYLSYLVAYGLLLGPAMTLSGSIGPATLVTRWFSQNRGLALGLVHLPIVVAILPVASNWMYEHYGAPATYLMLAALIGIGLIPLSLLTVDHPPGSEPQQSTVTGKTGTADGSMTVKQLLKMPRFWGFALSATALTTGAVTLGTVLVPMAISWGIERPNAALLASIMSLVGIIGSVAFGWVADRLGGARGLALLAFDCAILWSILLIHPPFPVLAVIIGLIGMHGAGMIPNLTRGISEIFGPESFSRGFGLATTFSLPFTVLAVIGSQAIYGATGSYSPAIVIMVGFYSVAMVLALIVRRGQVANLR